MFLPTSDVEVQPHVGDVTERMKRAKILQCAMDQYVPELNNTIFNAPIVHHYYYFLKKAD